MKITLEFKKEDLIRMDFIEKAINALLNEKAKSSKADKAIDCIWYIKRNK